MKQLYKISLHGGYCGLIAADTLVSAIIQAKKDQGSDNVASVTLATADEIHWIKAMGGQVPKIEPRLPSEWAREGYFVMEGKHMRIGANIDYYDRDGCKRQGTVKAYDGKTIVIYGERTMIVKETFKIKFGR